MYLFPIIDCFDGMPISWSISTSPNAEMANASLVAACSLLSDGEHPRVHSDRGAHYRWPGWIAICDEHELIRTMSRKGRTEDNARVSLGGANPDLYRHHFNHVLNSKTKIGKNRWS